MSDYITYRGAVYKKAAKLQVPDESYLRPAWLTLLPEVKKHQEYVQELVDSVIADANQDLKAEFAAFNKKVSEELFWAFVKGLMERGVNSLAKALHQGRLKGKITDETLVRIFGWQPLKIKPVQYRDMSKYFAHDKQGLGATYMKAVIDQLVPLL